MIVLNLQFFADGPGGEKTEKATPRKRRKAREEGRVAKSIEVNTALILITLFASIKIFGSNTYNKLILVFKNTYSLFKTYRDTLSIKTIMELMQNSLISIVEAVLPFMVTSLIIGLIASFMQVGWHPSTKPLKPKFNKLSPISGFKRLFSMRSIMELIKSIVKIVVIFAIVYVIINNKKKWIYAIFDLSLIDGVRLVFDLAIQIGIAIGGFFLIIALADFLYQKFSFEKEMKMTKQEVKEEHKEVEGNPQIKSKIRQKMREVSMKRMMQDLPAADVVITNPTHFAVAIQYDSNQSDAPRVLAKGVDFLAAKIKEAAKEYHIEIVENKPLARSLYYTVDIGEEIPGELYQAVAEVLAFVYSLKRNQQ